MRTIGSGRRRAALLRIALGALVALGSVFAQADSASARKRNVPRFRIYRWHGEVASDLRFDHDVRKTSGAVESIPKVTEDEWRVRELLELGGDGWLYHPALMQFTGIVGLLLDQDVVSSDPQDRTSRTYRQEPSFDVNADILPLKPYPISLFAHRSEAEIDSPLTPRRTVDTLRYGGALRLPRLSVSGLRIPVKLHYRHEETDTSGTFGNQQDRDALRLTADNRTERSRTRLQYEYEDLLSETASASRSSERQLAQLSHDYFLSRGQLSSRVLYNESRLDRDTTSWNLDESLVLRHDHGLSSTYGYSMTSQNSGRSRQLSNSGRFGVSHQLYQSLSSSFSLGGSHSDSDLGTILVGNVGLAFNYTKKIPGGRLGLRFSPSFAYQDEDVEPGLFSILDESHDVQIGQLILLDQPFVVESSVVVFDPATLFEFQEGIDYDLVPVGIQTAIQVIPGGDLDPAVPPLLSTVSVRYDYETLPARTFTTRTNSTGASLNLFEHWFFDFSHSRTNQDLRDGIETESTLEDSTRIRARAEANFRHSRTRFVYEEDRSEITPRTRYSAAQDFSFRPTPRSRLGLGLSFDEDRITDTNRTTETLTANVNGTHRFTNTLFGRLNLFARDVDQEEQDTRFLGMNVSFTYHYRQLRLELQENLDWRRSDSKTGTDQRVKELVNTFYFKIARPF